MSNALQGSIIHFFVIKRYANSGKRLLEILQFINFKCLISRKNGKLDL